MISKTKSGLFANELFLVVVLFCFVFWFVCFFNPACTVFVKSRTDSTRLAVILKFSI